MRFADAHLIEARRHLPGLDEVEVAAVAAGDDLEAAAEGGLDLVERVGEVLLVARRRQHPAEAIQRGGETGKLEPGQALEGARRADRVGAHDALAAVAGLDHEQGAVDEALPLGGGGQRPCGLDLGDEAALGQGDDLVDLAQGGESEQHDRGLDAAGAQPADVVEARLGQHGAAAGQHGAPHLGLAADALGDPDDGDAVGRAERHDGSRVTADLLAVADDPHASDSFSF